MFQNLMRIMCVVGALSLAGPAWAMEALDDEDLDRLTAAGDPVVMHSIGSTQSQVAYSDDSEYALTFDQPDAQSGIRALVVQNVVGELQLLVNLNVLSASNDVAGTDQRNFSLQSWGSTLPDPNTVKVAQAAPCMAVAGAPSPCGGNGGDGGIAGDAAAATGGSATINPSQDVSGNKNKVIYDNAPMTAKADASSSPGGNASGGSGSGPLILKVGDASTSVSNAASASGDVIAKAECLKDSTDCNAQVAIDNSPKYALNFKVSDSQSNLSALFVTNIVGRAQMALNLNIAAAQLNLIPGDTSTPLATPFNNATATIKQVNTGVQFRGTPLVGSSGITGTFNTSINHTNQ